MRLVLLLTILLTGCDSAVMNSDVARTRSVQRQEEYLRGIEKQLTRIANALEARPAKQKEVR